MHSRGFCGLYGSVFSDLSLMEKDVQAVEALVSRAVLSDSPSDSRQRGLRDCLKVNLCWADFSAYLEAI